MRRAKRTRQAEPNALGVRPPVLSPGVPSSTLGQLTRERLLSAAEEVALAIRIRQGDQAARKQLVEANMRLVIDIAKAYHSSTIPLEDLVQEGAIGLLTACERYDPGRGFRFSTYATHWVRQAISRAIDNKSRSIRVPAHVSERLRKIQRARAALLRLNGQEPTIEQIAVQTGITPHRIAACLQVCQDPVSLDMLVGDEANTALAALVGDRTAEDPADVLIRSEMQQELQRVLSTLTDREQRVMRRRLGMDDETPHMLQEIGDELHLSRERIRQIETQALRRLRSSANRKRLSEYLPD